MRAIGRPPGSPCGALRPSGCWEATSRGHHLKPTRRSRDAPGPVGRSPVLAGVRPAVDDRGAGDPVSVGSGVPDPVAGGAGEDRPRLRQPGQCVHRRQRDPDGPVRQGGCEGGDRARAFPGRRARRPLRRGDGRDRAGEDLGVARVARRRPGRASAFRVSPPVDLPEQLLLLHPRPGLGTRFS